MLEDDNLYSIKAKSVKLECDKFRLTVNSQVPGRVNQQKSELPTLGGALVVFPNWDGKRFLTGHAKTYGRNTLKHIRYLACGIFSHAANTGKLKTNPWHEVKIPGKVKDPEKTQHYTI